MGAIDYKFRKNGSSTPPILMYHRIVGEGPEELAAYRVSTVMFERQLSWLKSRQFRSVSLEEYWTLAANPGRQSAPARPVVLTFDDAYEDFCTEAWPLLKRYGFGATVFVPTAYVGGKADWDAAFGEPARILAWEQIIELSRQGVQFGSHGHAHVPLTQPNIVAAYWNAVRSRRILEKRLNIPIHAFCYPYSMFSRAVRLVVAAAGYRYAVGGAPLPSGRIDRFHIPRIEITGKDDLETFAAKVMPTCDR